MVRYSYKGTQVVSYAKLDVSFAFLAVSILHREE